MSDPRIQTRVDPEIEAAVEEYAEREHTNKSTAVRQFVVAGMDVYGELPDGVESPQKNDGNSGGSGPLEAVASKLTINTALVCLLATVATWLAAWSTFGLSAFLAVAFWTIGTVALVVAALLAVAAALASWTINQPLRDTFNPFRRLELQE